MGFAALLGACAAGAVWRGGPAERAGAALFAADWAAFLLTSNPWALMSADVAVLLALGRMAWKAPRTWPVWAGGCHAVAAAASLAFALQPDVGEDTWRRALLLAHAGAAVALAASVWRRRRARA